MSKIQEMFSAKGRQLFDSKKDEMSEVNAQFGAQPLPADSNSKIPFPPSIDTATELEMFRTWIKSGVNTAIATTHEYPVTSYEYITEGKTFVDPGLERDWRTWRARAALQADALSQSASADPVVVGIKPLLNQWAGSTHPDFRHTLEHHIVAAVLDEFAGPGMDESPVGPATLEEIAPKSRRRIDGSRFAHLLDCFADEAGSAGEEPSSRITLAKIRSKLVAHIHAWGARRAASASLRDMQYIGQLISLNDGPNGEPGTVFCDWNEHRYTLPPGTRIYADTTDPTPRYTRWKPR